MVFRGFIQRIIQKWFSKYKPSFRIAGVFTSLLFGLYHWQQGIFGVIPAAPGGFYRTRLLKQYNGNLWYPVVSHAFYDTIALTMIYLSRLNN
ncbi:CPBP family intramembrane glutamic endopeptidase [Parafilimonas sp.]|uniref:CPBP family intramembrane glutamic endopeptidase n=1 Tax=Parafilimonas sp. TaxID=1969739 RepID=UPI003F7D0EC2